MRISGLKWIPKNLLFFAALVLVTNGLRAQAILGPGLDEALASLLPTDKLVMILTYDQEGAVTQQQVNAVSALGIGKGLYFEVLPIMAVLANPAQILDLQWNHGVRSIWMNEPLVTYNRDSRILTGVDHVQSAEFQLESGLSLTGSGVTVLVNDSGIDALHGDLTFGQKVVQNVQGLTNLQALLGLLPATYLEGMANTDLLSGHGTHVAGTVSGTGSRSQGKYKGVATGAHLVGYGSGGAIAVLDALGGFDYALAHQYSFTHPIRIINNSWGSTGAFDPLDPVNLASYEAYKRGILPVFAAGNQGPGQGTLNRYAKAPWVVAVAAGTKSGSLADFSSRGEPGGTASFTMPDGTVWQTQNHITVTAPGVDVVSARALTNVTSNGGLLDLEMLTLQELPFYTVLSGTSMAAPHVAGIAALMLEANPGLGPLEVKELLMESATNMSGLAWWEAGAGYVNAAAAVAAAVDHLPDYGQTVNIFREFNSNAWFGDGGQLPFSLDFFPLGLSEDLEFQVAADTAWVTASGDAGLSTVALVLTDPDGKEYGSAIGLPLLGSFLSVSAPGKAGTWRLEVRGIGTLAGIDLDPLGLLQGIGLPGTVEGLVELIRIEGYQGLDDIAGHPAENAVKNAVIRRLMDGYPAGDFFPDAALTRGDFAEYLVMGAAIRQARPFAEPFPFTDVGASREPFVAAVTADGSSLKGASFELDPVFPVSGSLFRGMDPVTRLDLAYALVQNLGLQEEAREYDGNLVAEYNGQALAIQDQGQIPAAMRGYVQLAISLDILKPEIVQTQLLFLTVYKAYFRPNRIVSRADYAAIIGRYATAYP